MWLLKMLIAVVRELAASEEQIEIFCYLRFPVLFGDDLGKTGVISAHGIGNSERVKLFFFRFPEGPASSLLRGAVVRKRESL